MRCKDIMRTNIVVLKKHESVKDAVSYIVNEKQRFLPVVDDDGVFVGEIHSDDLLQKMLPMSASNYDAPAFLRETISEFRERFRSIENMPIDEFINRNPLVVNTNEPAIKAIMPIFKMHRNVSVVEADTKKLVGVITYKTILALALKGKVE